MSFYCHATIQLEALGVSADARNQLLEERQEPRLESVCLRGNFSGKEHQAYSNFCDLMPIYAERSLSYDSDALNAVSAVLEYLRHREDDPVYSFVGLPYYLDLAGTISAEHAVAQALSWYNLDTRPPQRRILFPSWTWVGWNKGYQFWYPLTRSNHAYLRNVFLEPKSGARLDLPDQGCDFQYASDEVKAVIFEAPIVPASHFSVDDKVLHVFGGDCTHVTSRKAELKSLLRDLQLGIYSCVLLLSGEGKDDAVILLVKWLDETTAERLHCSPVYKIHGAEFEAFTEIMEIRRIRLV